MKVEELRERLNLIILSTPVDTCWTVSTRHLLQLVNDAVAAERDKVAQWMIEQSYATGHGDTIEDLLKELEWQAMEREREACANICDGISEWYEVRTDLNQTQKQVGQLAAEVCGVRIRERT